MSEPETAIACTGAGDCPSERHIHGCFADLDFRRCESPREHDHVHFPLTFDGTFYVCWEGCLGVYSRRGAEAYEYECPVCRPKKWEKNR